MTRQSAIAFLALMALAIYTAPARAAESNEDFEAGYTTGDPLSNVWTDADGTADIFTIEDVGGTHNHVVRFNFDGPDPGPVLPDVVGQYFGWGGPTRNPTAFWMALDIEQGTTPDGSPTGSNIWAVNYNRQSGQNIIQLRGGLGTVQVRGSAGAFSMPGVALAPGWNQVIIMNDIAQTPNTKAWLNGVLIGSFNATTGGAASSSGFVGIMEFERLSRGGTGDGIVGQMRFDNIKATDYALIPEPTTMVLLGLGVVPAALLVRRRRKSA